MKLSPANLGMAEMVAAMVISGTIGWFVVMADMAPQTIVFYRCLFGALSLGAICALKGLFALRVTPRQLALAALGGVFIVGNWILIFAAFERASISIATITYQAQPFMLLFLGMLIFREQVRLWQVMWVLVAFGGIVLMSLTKPASLLREGEYLFGIALSLGAALLYAGASLITRHLKAIPPHLIAFIQMVVGAVLLLPFGLMASLPASPGNWASVIALGLIHTALMYILLYGAIQKLPLASIASLSFIYPVVALIVDVAAFSQRFVPLQIAGMMLVLLAAAGVNLGWRWKAAV